MKWAKRILVFVIILVVLGATFARQGVRAPVIDAQSGILPSMQQMGDPEVVVFVLDSPLDPAFVLGRALDMRPGTVSHGSLVGRVVRRYCRVTVVGLTVEDLGGAVDEHSYRGSLRSIRSFCRQHPHVQVLVNVSLGMEEGPPEERRLIADLRSSGALLIAAAGNDDQDKKVFPAGYSNTITVASANSEGKALHSNFGAWVDIGASGDISFVDEEFLPYERIRREMSARGTSFAAPRVTAALAWLLQRRPNMSPEEAWRRIEKMAGSVPGKHYREGKLGAGYLDIYKLKTSIEPAYRWLHYGLPAAFFCLVGLGTVWLVWRLGMSGIFVGMFIWLAALPAGIGLVIALRGYLECVQAGYRAAGPWPIGLAVGGCVLGAALLRFDTGSEIRAFVPGLGVAIVLRVTGLGGLSRGLSVAVLLLMGAAATKWYIHRRIAAVMRVTDEKPTGEAAEMLATIYHDTWNAQVRKAACQALGELPREEVLEHHEGLLHQPEKAKQLEKLLEARGWSEDI